MSAIADGDLCAFGSYRGRNGDAAIIWFIFFHRFQGILHQIDQHLLNLDPVGEDHIDAGIELVADGDTAFLGADQRQRHRFLDQLRKRTDGLLGFAAGDEIA